MLNFLNNRTDQVSTSITGIVRKPARTFGISVQTPQQFINPHTFISSQSHVNPHLKYEELRLSKLSSNQKSNLNNDWTRKTNMNLIEEEKVVNKQGEGKNRSYYHDMYKIQLAKGNSRFRLTRGQFSSFLHQQIKNQVIDPIGPQRTLQRARQTKKSIMQQSISSLQKLKSNPSLLSTYRASTLRRQKLNFRKSRQILHKSIQVQQQNRRYSKSPKFLLPKMTKINLKPNTHRLTQIQQLCQNYLQSHFRTIHITNRD